MQIRVLRNGERHLKIFLCNFWVVTRFLKAEMTQPKSIENYHILQKKYLKK